MITQLWIYGALALSSLINILVPISGSSTVTPFLALLTDPHRAIGIASFYFVLSGIVRILLFRKHIQWHDIRTMLGPSAIAAFFGALALVAVPSKLLLLLVLAITVYFFAKKINIIPERRMSHLTNYLVGLFSGFLQGTGLAGSDLRNSYLYAEGLTIAQVHGTTALIGSVNFLIATIVRLYTKQLTVPDLTPLIYISPFIVIGILAGRHLLFKLPKRITNGIVVGVMLTIILFLALKVFGINI